MNLRVIEHGSTEYDESVKLRDRILRKPLGLEFTDEQLAAEVGMQHIAGFIEGVIRVCCILIANEDKRFQVRQVAVDERLQRRGFGKKLMEFAELQAELSGADSLFCHARLEAEPFYKALEYKRIGEPFEEVSIMHVEMEKTFTQ